MRYCRCNKKLLIEADHDMASMSYIPKSYTKLVKVQSTIYLREICVVFFISILYIQSFFHIWIIKKCFEHVTGNQDVFISMPTGSGKSLCFQLPAVLQQNKVAVVFSPLLALMKVILFSKCIMLPFEIKLEIAIFCIELRHMWACYCYDGVLTPTSEPTFCIMSWCRYRLVKNRASTFPNNIISSYWIVYLVQVIY